MQWTNNQRELLYLAIERKWSDCGIDEFEEWMASLGIKWAELYHESDSPPGTVAVHEGPGIEDINLRMCWVVPDEIALKLLTLGTP